MNSDIECCSKSFEKPVAAQIVTQKDLFGNDESICSHCLTPVDTSAFLTTHITKE